MALENGMTAAEVKAVLVNELYEFYPVTEDIFMPKHLAGQWCVNSNSQTHLHSLSAAHILD